MTIEVILSYCLGQHVSNLIDSSYWEGFDRAILHMFTEVVVADIDVLSAWAKFWKSCKFQCTRSILKDLAVHIWLGANDWDVALPHFLDETHDWNNILKGHGHGNVLSLSG